MDETWFPDRTKALPMQWGDVLTSTDLDEVREWMARYLCSHELEITERGARLKARVRVMWIGQICVMYVEYGAPVRVKPGETGFVPVQAHFAGEGIVRCGRRQVRTCRERGWVGNPDEPLEMWLSADAKLVLARFELLSLRTTTANLIGDHVPLRSFELGMDVVNGFPCKWLGVLRNQIRSGAPDALAVPALEELFTTSLLRAQPNNCSNVLAAAPGRPASSRSVCQAIEIIEADPRQGHSASSVAGQLGTTGVALDTKFLDCRGVSVADFVQRVRLERVYDELIRADPALTAAEEVACRWGLGGLEQFERAYAERFGESAAETLRRY